MTVPNCSFYFRYYVGHEGRFGHEFLEFEIREDGRLRYANNSQYKSDTLIKREVIVSPLIVKEMTRIIETSDILSVSDAPFPEPDSGGRQELEVVCGGKAVCLTTSKIGSMGDILKSRDPEGLTKLYYLVQDMKCFVFSLISLHFRVKPI